MAVNITLIKRTNRQETARGATSHFGDEALDKEEDKEFKEDKEQLFRIMQNAFLFLTQGQSRI